MSDEINPFTMILQDEEEDVVDQKESSTTPIAVASQHQEYFLDSIESTISIRQLPSEGLSFQLWPAASTLVNLLNHYCSHQLTTSSPLSSFLNAQSDRPLRLLELGSGTGIVGIAAAALLGAHVTVTDLPHVLPNIQFNIDANAGVWKAKGGSIGVTALRWGETQDMEAVGTEFDLVLASDVVYHDHLYEPLLQTLRLLMLGSENKMVFVMSHLKRWKKEATFFKKASKLFEIDVLYNDVPRNGSRTGVVVYSFVRKCSSNLTIHQ